jgi:peroxiredoxin
VAIARPKIPTTPEKNKKSRRPLFLTLIAIGVFLVGAGLIQILVNEQAKALEGSGLVQEPVVMNQAAPDLKLIDLQGNPVSLRDYGGDVVLINNWATWCPPCQTEMPELQAYYRAHSGQGFVVVAIESADLANAVSDFVQQNGMTFPVWLDLQGAAVETFNNWDLPSSYVIDQKGLLRMGWTGPVTQATLEKYVTPLLTPAAY